MILFQVAIHGITQQSELAFTRHGDPASFATVHGLKGARHVADLVAELACGEVDAVHQHFPLTVGLRHLRLPAEHPFVPDLLRHAAHFTGKKLVLLLDGVDRGRDFSREATASRVHARREVALLSGTQLIQIQITFLLLACLIYRVATAHHS